MSPLLNYTTKVPATRTVSEIERILAAHGAKAVLKEYGDDGEVSAIFFKAQSPYGELAIRLPIDVTAVFQILHKQWRNRELAFSYVKEPQARRIAWRILKDWVEAQMAILETEMVRLEQIFLPYVVTDTGKTIYERMLESKFKLLGAGSEEQG